MNSPPFPQSLKALRVWLKESEEGRVIVREAARGFLENGSLSELLDSTPPHDLQIERGLIGMFIMYPRMIGELSSEVRVEHFHAGRNRTLHGHLLSMWNGGQGGVDLSLLYARLKERGDFERLGGAAYLNDLLNSATMPSLGPNYAKVLREHAIRRAIINTADRMLVHAYAARMPVRALIEKTRVALDKAAEGET